MRTVSTASVAAHDERIEGLPATVLEALGELVGAAKEGLLALSVGVGLGVLHEVLEAEVDEVVGTRGKHIPDRAAVRHGLQDPHDVERRHLTPGRHSHHAHRTLAPHEFSRCNAPVAPRSDDHSITSTQPPLRQYSPFSRLRSPSSTR